MTDLPRMIVIEPAAEQSKHRAAGIFARKEKKERPDIAAIKERLREIRRTARDDHAELLTLLKGTLSRYVRVVVSLAAARRGQAEYGF